MASENNEGVKDNSNLEHKFIYLYSYPTYCLDEKNISELNTLSFRSLDFLRKRPEIKVILISLNLSEEKLAAFLTENPDVFFGSSDEHLFKQQIFAVFHLSRSEDLSNLVMSLESQDTPLMEHAASNQWVSFSRSALSIEFQDILERKKNILERRIKTLREKKDGPRQVEEKLNAAENYINLFENFNPIFEKTEVLLTKIFLELYKLLLFCEVEINFAEHFGIDPVLGWLNRSLIGSDNSLSSVSNPFLSIDFDEKGSGSIKNVDYFPRKESIADFRDGYFFSSPLFKSENSSSAPPRQMRNNPDLFAMRFIESHKLLGDEHLNIHKVFYLKSGLSSLGHHSTTGFEFDFWAESDSPLSISQTDYLKLNIPLSLNCPNHLIRFRYLSDIGGVSNEVFSLSDSQADLHFSNKNTKGGLKGIRVIDSVNQFVLDYRFSQTLIKISITSLPSKLPQRSGLLMEFDLELKHIFSYELAKNLTFSIY